MVESQYKKEIVNFFLNNDILLDIDSLDKFSYDNMKVFYNYLRDKQFVIDSSVNEDNYLHFMQGVINKYSSELQQKVSGKLEAKVEVVFSYKDFYKKKDLNDFVNYFNCRYKQLRNILDTRPELTNLTAITRVTGKNKDNVSIIGMIIEKEQTKNNNIMLTVEDPTGVMKVLVTQNKEELYNIAQNLVYDEVIGINGVAGDKIIFANNILFPDIPLTKELKKSPEEVYAVFLSDVHVGSGNFLGEKYDKFIKWINGKIGSSEQREMVKKIRYVFIAGDLVDGIGIYPGQDKDLMIKDIYEQYTECARLLSQIPEYIQIIICPGNHDAMRLSEPQPLLYKDYAQAIYELPNVTLVSNPAVVNVHKTDGFPGFNVLMYHGSSFDYYLANVDELRLNGGYDRPDLMMKFLLQRRHLAPTYNSTPCLPDGTKDNLVIETIPDIFLTGHIHKCTIANYRNVTLVAGSTWQERTEYEAKLGHHPEPARVPLINLKTRKAKILKF